MIQFLHCLVQIHLLGCMVPANDRGSRTSSKPKSMRKTLQTIFCNNFQPNLRIEPAAMCVFLGLRAWCDSGRYLKTVKFLDTIWLARPLITIAVINTNALRTNLNAEARPILLNVEVASFRNQERNTKCYPMAVLVASAPLFVPVLESIIIDVGTCTRAKITPRRKTSQVSVSGSFSRSRKGSRQKFGRQSNGSTRADKRENMCKRMSRMSWQGTKMQTTAYQ